MPLVVVAATAQTWTPFNPSLKPSPRSGHAMIFDPVSARVMLFSGDTSIPVDTWLWDGTAWTRAQTPANMPARRFHALAHDPIRHETVLFGGVAAGDTFLNDTWVWNGTAWSRRTSPGTPDPRRGHAMAWDPVSQRIILYGGFARSPGSTAPYYAADTWAWNGGEWQRLNPSTSPSRDFRQRAVPHPVTRQIVLTSGHTWNGSDWELKAFPPSIGPGAAFAVDETAGKLIAVEDRTTVWDGTAARRVAAALAPPNRTNAAAAWDPVRREIVLFGGNADAADLGDTWRFTLGAGCTFADPLSFDWILSAASPAGETRESLLPISAGCTWHVSSDQPWITFAQTSGLWTTPVRVTIAPNTALVARFARITVSGLPLGLKQDKAPCPGPQPLPTESFLVRAGCNNGYVFQATAGEQFAVQAIGSSGPGIALSEAMLTLVASTGLLYQTTAFPQPLARLPVSGMISIPSTGTWILYVAGAGEPEYGLVRARILRSGHGCTPDINRELVPFTGASIPSSSTSIGLRVGIPPDCPGTITSGQPWLAVSANSLTPGFHALTLTAPRNYGATRTAAVTVGSSTYAVTQEGTSCTFRASSDTTSAPAGLSLGRITIEPSASGCGWDAVSSVPWLQPYPLTGNGQAQIGYTVFPNFSGRARQGTITAGNVPIVISQAASGLPVDRRFIQLLYFSFFGRMPGQAELDFQAASGQTRQQLALNFLNSQEFLQGGRFVAGLYFGIMDRDPEYGGWLFQRNALASGAVTVDILIENFLNSLEFMARNRALDGPAFVRLLYHQILFREPTAAEVVFHWQGGLTRAQLTRNFLSSAEFRQGVNARLTAFLLYATLLQRAPGSAELEASATALTRLDKIGNENARQIALRDQFLGPFVNGAELNLNLQ